jgi:hypothetical protein
MMGQSSSRFDPCTGLKRGSPSTENFLFGNAGLSMNDLNNKGTLAFLSARESARVFDLNVLCGSHGIRNIF